MDRRRETFATCARLLLIGLLASCASLDVADTEPATAAAETAPRVAEDHAAFAVTEQGPVRGVATDTTVVFRGIPYAAPPVGDLRWRPPQPPARHRGVLDAIQFASHCPQMASPFGQGSTTEDCLFLNVFAPNPPHDRDRDRDDDGGLRPVMVWIHGGALLVGESNDYDATRLVEQGGVIVVTINYRLGELGFLAHPALTAESPDHASGNYGLLDQQEALRWVRRNIPFFGGDPDRVTIFGESTGGISVHSHLVSPSSAGLFQRAIAESADQLTQPSLADAEVTGTAFAAAAGCTDQTAVCLRGLSVAQILAAQPSGVPGMSPTVDNKFLPQSIGAAFASGQFNRVPILEGINHDEMRLFVALTELQTGAPLSTAAYPAAIQATLGVPAAAVPQFVAQYPLASFASPSLALATLGTDGIFACNVRFVEQHVSQFVPTFAYEFNDPNAPERFLPPVSFPYAAAHVSEIQYVFDLPVTVPAPGLDAEQQKLAATMVSYWTTFARTGQPSSRGLPAFPAYHAASDVMQSLVPPQPQPETGFAAAHHCAFWDSLRR